VAATKNLTIFFNSILEEFVGMKTRKKDYIVAMDDCSSCSPSGTLDERITICNEKYILWTRRIIKYCFWDVLQHKYDKKLLASSSFLGMVSCGMVVWGDMLREAFAYETCSLDFLLLFGDRHVHKVASMRYNYNSWHKDVVIV
jgi:hypothetical protein